jgi:hypothetical protein
LDRARGDWVRKDDESGLFLRGMFFDESSWDGADCFVPEGTVYIFITGRVRSLLSSKKNVRLLSDVLTSEVVIRNSSPSAAR